MLDLGDRVVPDTAPPPAAEEEAPKKIGAFRRLRESLAKSRRALTEEIGSSLFDRIDDETWERLEEALILADAGATTTAQVVEKLEHEVDSGAVPPD
ncbi:MAG: signal recognition particle receptor subunit alpha, partial [Solirubrobacterales bacterium]|nr:signal recognition particle receptor subunit alpha [Solirubrobacterales bacterium]